MALLDTYLDPALEIDTSESVEDVSEHERERLAEACAVLATCAAIPRRLSDANREELALDKKRARRALHVCRQSLLAWGGKEREPTPDERSAGAQLGWEAYSEAWRVVVQARLRYVSSWAKKTGNLRFGKSAVVRLSQELEWLEYALRD